MPKKERDPYTFRKGNLIEFDSGSPMHRAVREMADARNRENQRIKRERERQRAHSLF